MIHLTSGHAIPQSLSTGTTAKRAADAFTDAFQCYASTHSWSLYAPPTSIICARSLFFCRAMMSCFSRKATPEEKRRVVVRKQLDKVHGVQEPEALLAEYHNLTGALGGPFVGVELETVKSGTGMHPQKGQTVTVHYTDALCNGKKFDSSRDRGKPFSFRLGLRQVIRCWDEGIAQMRVEERARLMCSPDYGYGRSGYTGVIRPNATPIFDVELIAAQ